MVFCIIMFESGNIVDILINFFSVCIFVGELLKFNSLIWLIIERWCRFLLMIFCNYLLLDLGIVLFRNLMIVLVFIKYFVFICYGFV